LPTNKAARIHDFSSENSSCTRFTSIVTERGTQEVFFTRYFKKESPQLNEFLVTEERSWSRHGSVRYKLEKQGGIHFSNHNNDFVTRNRKALRSEHF
jgi:hypothetical protein